MLPGVKMDTRRKVSSPYDLEQKVPSYHSLEKINKKKEEVKAFWDKYEAELQEKEDTSNSLALQVAPPAEQQKIKLLFFSELKKPLVAQVEESKMQDYFITHRN